MSLQQRYNSGERRPFLPFALVRHPDRASIGIHCHYLHSLCNKINSLETLFEMNIKAAYTICGLRTRETASLPFASKQLSLLLGVGDGFIPAPLPPKHCLFRRTPTQYIETNLLLYLIIGIRNHLNGPLCDRLAPFPYPILHGPLPARPIISKPSQMVRNQVSSFTARALGQDDAAGVC